MSAAGLPLTVLMRSMVSDCPINTLCPVILAVAVAPVAVAAIAVLVEPFFRTVIVREAAPPGAVPCNTYIAVMVETPGIMKRVFSVVPQPPAPLFIACS